MQGNIVLKQPILQQKTEINIENLSTGVYNIAIGNDKNTIVSKFIKE